MIIFRILRFGILGQRRLQVQPARANAVAVARGEW